MSKTYGFAEQKYIDLLNNLINTKEEFDLIKAAGIRISLITVENCDGKTGMTMPSMKGLPYRAKFNNIKDRIISNKDVVFFLDKYYLDRCLTVNEWEALIYSCLNSIDFVVKDGEPKIDTDGRVKLKAKTPDMSFEGYSENCEKYKQDSPEIKLYNEMISEYCDTLHGGTTLD